MTWDAQTCFMAGPYPGGMMFRSVAAITGVILLASCQVPTDAPSPPSTPSSADSGTEDSSATADGQTPSSPAPSFCDEFDPAALTWFDLGGERSSTERLESGSDVQVSSARLPDTRASRYNTISEVCPGFFLVTTYSGDTRLLTIAENKWAELPSLTPAGELQGPVAPGVEAGGPAWGFRDSLVVGDALYLSDAEINTDQDCVTVAVHRLDLAAMLTAGSPAADIIYRSEPCVSYTDDYRSRAPIKVHLGGALAYHDAKDELYVSIGDLHLGSSRIGQAEAIGIPNVERDYALLTDPDTAVSAVVAISEPDGSAQPRIFAKGLRNSLGMTLSTSGELWLTDHGPRGGDEVNVIEEGADYGWPLTSEGEPYDRSAYPEDASALPAPWLDIYLAELEGSTGPVYSWTPAVAPTSIVEYPHAGIDGWGDGLVISSLRAESLVHLTLDSGTVLREDRLSLAERIRDMVVTESGQLVMVTDSSRLLVVSG